MILRPDGKPRAGNQRFSRYLRTGASLGIVLMLLAACSCGSGASGAQTTSGSQTASTTGGGSTSTATNAPTATTTHAAAPTATTTHAAAPTATHAPAPTATHAVAPTPTPVPPLQSQPLAKGIYAIAAGTASSVVDITCPSGYLVAGGGPNSTFTNFTMMQDGPISTTTWRAEVFNNNSTGTISVQEQIICLKVVGLQSKVFARLILSIAPGKSSGNVDMPCPSGYLVTGGGPISMATNFTMMWNAPLNTTTWRAEVFNNDPNLADAPINVTEQIVCLQVSGLTSQIITKGLNNIAAGTYSSAVDLTCPSGYLVAGGGPDTGATNFTMMRDTPINSTTWQAQASSDATGIYPLISVQEQAVCLKH